MKDYRTLDNYYCTDVFLALSVLCTVLTQDVRGRVLQVATVVLVLAIRSSTIGVMLCVHAGFEYHILQYYSSRVAITPVLIRSSFLKMSAVFV
jgi:hypothetical protein